MVFMAQKRIMILLSFGLMHTYPVLIENKTTRLIKLSYVHFVIEKERKFLSTTISKGTTKIYPDMQSFIAIAPQKDPKQRPSPENFFHQFEDLSKNTVIRFEEKENGVEFERIEEEAKD
jgi:hypothetical protein